jgi:hypothetical protein
MPKIQREGECNKMKRRVVSVLVTMALALGLSLMTAIPVQAATYTVSSNQNWSAFTTTPTSADTVIVRNQATLTIDVSNAVVGTLQLGSNQNPNSHGTLAFNSNSGLTVVNNIIIGRMVALY